MISTDPQRVKAAQINVVVVTCFCPVGDVGSGGPFTENPTLLICSRYLVALTEVPVTMCLVGTSALGRASGRGWFGLTVRAGRGLGTGSEECGASCAEGGPRGGGDGGPRRPACARAMLRGPSRRQVHGPSGAVQRLSAVFSDLCEQESRGRR